ncbi:MAG: RidA family protein [Oscillospiraceae bacterium]|nr:RidA family protein [Oscillospiraceae bacterium]
MDKQIISTGNAPQAIGPYSQGIAFDRLVFTSGPLPLDPDTGRFPVQDIESQTAQSLTNIRVILEAAGSGMDKVLKTTVFLADIGDFDAMNQVYQTFFPQSGGPARSAVQVAALPKGARLEIEAVAWR